MSVSLPILTEPQAHESFRAARELESRLRATLPNPNNDKIRFDLTSRALYTTDASNYRQVPIGVVFPSNAEDVLAAVEICRSLGAPILARGAGTSLAGQTCNTALVFDFSRHMRRLHALDPHSRTATVEPGIVLDRVREAAERHNLTFAPDPATHSRCTLGGMIGNNSCGTHALMGGKTVDNIRSLDILLYDGTRLTVGPTTPDEYRAILQRGGRIAQLYQGMRQLVDLHADHIRSGFPRIPRRVSGYNLDELLPENGFHVARALVGSEGTLATILSATLDLVPSPPCRRLVVLGFPDAFLAADAVPAILQHHPIGLEGFDHTLLENMHRKNLAVAERKMLPAGGGFLLVEFGAATEAEVDAISHAFRDAAQSIPHALAANIFSGEDAARIWRVRESALGATVFVPGQPHQWEGWEDAAVPPTRLGEYLRKLFALMREYGYHSPLYGHYGQGCVHMRINFDFESEPGLHAYRGFIDRAADLVVSLGGSISGEHGDGQSRAALLPKMFGPQIMQAFRDFKRLWDPDNRMNPGKLISAESGIYQPTQNLRIGPGHKAAHPATYFSFDRDHGSFGESTLRCVGVGACRKTDSGVMCPSYMATREEQHSTRGRAHLLWEMLEGNLLPTDWNNPGVKQALDLCLSCKACKSECPVSVDMASWKAEFLAHYYETQPRELRHYLFGFMDRWAQIAAAVPGLSQRLANLPLQIPPIQSALKTILGIAPQRQLPQFAPRTFQQQWRAQNSPPSPTLPQAILWPDTWNNYYHPQSLHAAGQILHTAGYAVHIPRQHVCCGRPLYDFGFLDAARNYLRRILTQFAPQIDAGLPVIFLEPSCASVLRNELLDFFPHDDRARRLADQTLLLSQFLTRHAPNYQPAQHPDTRILLHGHCHHKAVFNMEDELLWLRRTGAQVELLDAGCCGMAGPFGFEREHYSVSQTLAERVLLPAARNAAPADILVTDGFSCREQITQNTPRHPQHFAEVLCPAEQASQKILSS